MLEVPLITSDTNHPSYKLLPHYLEKSEKFLNNISHL